VTTPGHRRDAAASGGHRLDARRRRGVPALIGVATVALVAVLVVAVAMLGRPAAPAASPEAVDAGLTGGTTRDDPERSPLLLPVSPPPSSALALPANESGLPIPVLPSAVPAPPVVPRPPRPPAPPRPPRPLLTGPAAAVVALTNAERAKAGCKPLTVDPRLITSALRHSQDMSRRGYFEHESPEGTDFSDREKAAGFRGRGGGENIAKGQETATEVMADWMSSPGHRRNILDCSFTSIGVGYVADGRYWTQNFGRS
jgi:uncharacterized protein YkwD